MSKEKFKTQKGITLIGLIITIIVMLILVGVSVTVALNGELFTTAKQATSKTQLEADKEQLLELAIGAIGTEGEVIFSDLDTAVQEDGKFTKTADKTYKSVKSGNIFIVSEYGSVTILEALPAEVQVGSYVRYNVTYKDVYSEAMPKFTADNGWRYLGKDSDNNHLLVSTGIPAKLYYIYNDADTIGNKADRDDGKGNDWWATNAQITALPTTSQFYTDKGYVRATGASTGGYPNKYATYGMRYNFESIPFAKSGSATKNAGCYTEIDSETTTVNGSVFRAEGFEDETKVQIRSLTLEDINRATNAANGNNDRTETSTSSGFKDITGTNNVALGLFDMYDLTDYGGYYYYWLANPHGTAWGVLDVICYDNYLGTFNNGDTIGVRPVIILSSDYYNIVESKDEGVYKIEKL